MFDFSVETVENSFKESLKKLQLDYVDLIQVHDVEFSRSIDQIVKFTLPALKRLKEQGLCRYIGITGYNLGILKKIVRQTGPGTIDTILSYSRCNLLNQDLLDDLDFYEQNAIGVINASPLALGLLNNECTFPDWHLAPCITQEATKKAAKLCLERSVDLGKSFIACINNSNTLMEATQESHLVFEEQKMS